MFSSRLVSRQSGSPRSGLKRRPPGHRGCCTPSFRSGGRWGGRTTRRSSAMCWKPRSRSCRVRTSRCSSTTRWSSRTNPTQPLACTIPLSHDVGLHPAIAEALGLRAAYERHRGLTGRTFVSRLGGPERVPRADRGAGACRRRDARSTNAVYLRRNSARPRSTCARTTKRPRWPSSTTYRPRGRAESWFYTATETGAVLRRARAAIRAADGPRQAWFPMVPIGQPT